ncbi:MAG TPA: hypothetical protein VMX75_16330, partial [Spirochaetia bacterium]|nr:hypothetical protein [Spirochaetia bacterium]
SREPLDFQQATLHPLLALCVPFLFLFSITEILNALAAVRLGAPIVFYFLLLTTGLEETIVGNILFKEKIGGMERLREILLILLTVLLLFFLLQRGSLVERWEALGNWKVVFVLFCVLFQWIMSFHIHTCLRDRELLLSALKGKSGDELVKALRNNSQMASISLSSLRRVKRLILIFQILIFILLLILFGLKIKMGTSLMAGVMLNALAAILFTFTLNSALSDQLLCGEGISVNRPLQRRRAFYAFIIVSLSLFLVISFARMTSILPLTLFQPLLDWLGTLFSFKERPVPIVPRADRFRERQELARMLEQMNPEPSLLLKLLGILIAVIGRIILMGIGLLFLYFLFSPLLSRYFRLRFLQMSPFRVILNRIASAVRLVRRVFYHLMRWFRTSKFPRLQKGTSKDEVGRWRRFAIVKPGIWKRLEMGRVLRAFSKLIRWSKGKGVEYEHYLAPLEFARCVSLAVPAQEEYLRESMEIMEEALFSPVLLPKERLNRYFSLIRNIIKGEA